MDFVFIENGAPSRPYLSGIVSPFFFFRVQFKSIGAKPHVRPYNYEDYLRPLVP